MDELMNEESEKQRKHIVFLSSLYVNLAKLFAENNKDFDVFLIIDRKFPFEIEDLDNFYTFTFDKKKIYEKDKERYFDNLAVMINKYDPDFIVCNNFSKLLPKSFIEFMNFRNPNIKILNLHHGDLRIKDDEGKMRFEGLQCDIKEFLDEAMIITTIHHIEDDGMDNGAKIAYSHETTLKELKQKAYAHKREDILNYRLRNVILSYHERTKVLKLLRRVLEEISKNS